MENTTEKEYDLMDILISVWNGVKNCATWCQKAFLWSSRLAYRYKWIMLVAILLGTGWGVRFSYKHRLKLVYTTESQMRIYVGSPFVAAEQLQYLDKLAANENYDRIAELTGLTAEQAQNVKGVRSYFVLSSPYDGALSETDYENKFIEDTTLIRSRNHLTVQVLVSDPNLTDSLAFALENFLRGSQYMQSESEIERKRLSVLHEQYKTEVQALDSLRGLEYFDKGRNAGNVKLEGGVFVNERTHYLYHNDIVALREAARDVESHLDLVDRIAECQHAFYIKKASFEIIKITLKRIIFVCGIFFIFLCLFDSRKRILEQLKG